MTKTIINQTTSPSWDTIHIFGYGETQLNGLDLSKKYSTSDLTKVQEVIDYIYSLKPEGNPTSTEYHVINIFKNWKVEFKSKPLTFENSFSIKYADLDTTTIDALAEEIISYVEPTIVEPTI